MESILSTMRCYSFRDRSVDSFNASNADDHITSDLIIFMVYECVGKLLYTKFY